MESLAPLMIVSILTCALIGGVLLFLRDGKGSDYLTYWAVSFFIVGVQHGFAIWTAFQTPHPLHGGLLNLANLVAGGFVLVGTYAFLERPAPRIWLAPASLVAVWSLAAPFWDVGFLAATGPAFWFRGLSDMFAGAIIGRGKLGVRSRLAGVALFLWGAHQLNFPFLRPVLWLAPWGFALAMILAIAVGVGLLMTHYEITRHELATSENEFRNLFESSADGIFLADPDGKLLKVNPALERILGYDPEELAGLTLNAIDMTPNTVFGDNGDEGAERIWKRKDGRQVQIILRTRETQTSRLPVIAGSVRDVTHTRMLQEQLNLARRMDALGRLAGGIAHDFNNILTAILGSVDLVELQIEAKRSPAATLEILRMSTLQAADLSSQLLAFTRQKSGESGPVSIHAAVDNTVSMLHRLLPDSISLVVQSDAPDALVMSEAGQLERVILNLAVNAQDAMPNGGVLEISTRRSDPEHVLLSVRDSGVGIDPETLHQIFEPFFSTKGVKGTGLGLANVFMLVEAMGGTIAVESAIGAGSTFSLTLPITDPESPELTAKTRSKKTVEEPTTSAPRLLLVEDRELVRNSVQAILQHAGYHVVTAVNGEDAMKIMAKIGDEIDVVLTDVLMPIMSGPALIDHLLVLRPDLKFLMISGHPEDELEQFGLLDRHFLAKPFSAADLLEKLAKVRED